MPVRLFPNWIVKLVRSPNLRTKQWLDRPVEVFQVSPKMTKFEIKEYLIQLYNLPVSHVHTAIYEPKPRINQEWMVKVRQPAYKKAYVYLHDSMGQQKPRYHLVEEALTEQAREAWPTKPHRVVQDPRNIKKELREPPAFGRDRKAVRQKKLQNRPYDSIFPDDLD